MGFSTFENRRGREAFSFQSLEGIFGFFNCVGKLSVRGT
ncbi:hypothetical protein CKA32_000685 [Geitlerinema sp. FC II]|nr:hypothetical protein CKA32_000685 [Geitlerinema sp. FC II]